MAPTRKLKLASTMTVALGMIVPIVLIRVASFEPWQSRALAIIGVLLMLVGLCALVSTNRKDHQ